MKTKIPRSYLIDRSINKLFNYKKFNQFKMRIGIFEAYELTDFNIVGKRIRLTYIDESGRHWDILLTISSFLNTCKSL